jgi:hypothetical protein
MRIMMVGRTMVAALALAASMPALATEAKREPAGALADGTPI